MQSVFPAFQFPSWYNDEHGTRLSVSVFPAFQFPSWYNSQLMCLVKLDFRF